MVIYRLEQGWANYSSRGHMQNIKFVSQAHQTIRGYIDNP